MTRSIPWSMWIGKLSLLSSVWFALFTAPGSAHAKECEVEADGKLLRQDVDRMPKLVDPRCIVKSSTTAVVIVILDGRYVEHAVAGGRDVLEYTEMEIFIPFGCAAHEDQAFVRAKRTKLEVTATFKHTVGIIERKQRPVEAHLICGAVTTYVAMSSGDLIRMLISYQER